MVDEVWVHRERGWPALAPHVGGSPSASGPPSPRVCILALSQVPSARVAPGEEGSGASVWSTGLVSALPRPCVSRKRKILTHGVGGERELAVWLRKPSVHAHTHLG